MALYINTVLFIFFVLFFNCTLQQSPSPEPETNTPQPSPNSLTGNTVPQPSLNSGSSSPTGSSSPALCCSGSPMTSICPDGITSIEAACDNSTCKWFFAVACPAAPSFQVCQCPLYNLPQCGNATVTCLPKGSSCGYECGCENICSGPTPCSNAYCGFNKTSLSCQWVDTKCSFPVVSKNVNCSAPGACIRASSNCSNGVVPKCLKTGQTCSNVCPAPMGSGITIDCTGQCSGTPACNGALCKLVTVNLQNFQTLTNLTNFTSLTNLTSNSTIPAQCQWSCPDRCSSWCSAYQCPMNTSLVSCGPSPYDISSCLPVCASPVCNKQCLELQCGVGSTATCTGNNSCSMSCPSSSCNNPCAPNCAPICSLGGSRQPCINSTCSLPFNTTLPSYYSAASLSKCEWIPSNDNGICITEPPKKCVGTPQCAYSACKTDVNGTNYWDNTLCRKDCSLLSQAQCPGGFQKCTAGPGFCLLAGSDCSWTCPIDPCLNSSGMPTCQNATPVAAPFVGCLSWNARCLVSNSSTVPPVCQWQVQCTQVNQSLTGPCLTSDCGSFPNTTCPGQALGTCLRLNGAGPCEWVYTCPPSASACTEADCPPLDIVENNFTSVCGINPTAKAMCIRNAKGYCERTPSCFLAYNPPACQTSTCGDICYDPRWTTGELVAPDYFNASLLQQNPANCSLCARRCSTYLFCGRPSNNPICQFSQSTAYTQCLAKCNSTLQLLPNSLLNNTSSAQCSGNDPCACNYSACTFVQAQYSYGMYAECLSNQQANFALSLPGVQSVYSRVSLPPYCQVLQYFGNTNNNITSSAQNLIWMINNLNANSLQQSLLDQSSSLTSPSFTNYFAQINQLLQPSEINGSLVNSSSPLLKISAIVTLTGANAPNQTDLDNWCYFILHSVIEKALNLSDSQVGPCVLTPLSSNWNSNGFTGTYILSSIVNPYGSLSNLTSWTPQPLGWNGTIFTPLPLQINGTGPSSSPQASSGPGASPGPGANGPSGPTVVGPPVLPTLNLTQPGVTAPTKTPPAGSQTPTTTTIGPSSPTGSGSRVSWSMSVLLLVLGGFFLNL